LTYLTITTTGLLENLEVPTQIDAELKLLKMVEKSGFSVRINQSEKYISFENSGDSFDTDKTVTYLRGHIHDTISLHKQIASVDRSIEKTDKYVQKLIQNDRGDRGDRLQDDFGQHVGNMGHLM